MLHGLFFEAQGKKGLHRRWAALGGQQQYRAMQGRQKDL